MTVSTLVGTKISNTAKLTFADPHAFASKCGEPMRISDKQERYENLLNQYLLRSA